MKKLIFIASLMAGVMLCQLTFAQSVSGQKSPSGEDSLHYNLQKAQALVKEGKKEQASKILTGIMETHPHNKEAVQWWLIANMKRTPTGEVDAIPMLDSLGAIYPTNTGILFFKIFIQAEYGMNEEALPNAEKLIKMEPDSADNWILKGQILHEMERHKDACTAFEKALELNPLRTDVYGMLAISYCRTGDFPKPSLRLMKVLSWNQIRPITITTGLVFTV